MKIYFYFLKQHKMAGSNEERIPNRAEGVAAEGNGMTQEVNDKRGTLKKNFEREDIGLIRAYKTLGIDLPLPEKMTISPELDPDLNKKVQEVMKNMKKNPHLYKAGEDVTSYSTTKNKDGSYSIDGFSFHSVLSKGDYLVVKCTIGGEPGYLRAIITDIVYTNPREYFNGNMIVVNFCDENGSDID